MFLVVACGSRDSTPRDQPPASSEIWGLRFTELLSHENVSLLRHATDEQRVDLTIVREVRPDVAREMILEKLALFESSFVPGRTGYPGQHTRRIEYPERFEPKRFERDLDGGHLTYFTSYATANFVHGASSEDLAAYRSLYGLLYCADRELLIEIDQFVELDQDDGPSRFVAGIACDFE